jgi:hypothetical protein
MHLLWEHAAPSPSPRSSAILMLRLLWVLRVQQQLLMLHGAVHAILSHWELEPLPPMSHS